MIEHITSVILALLGAIGGIAGWLLLLHSKVASNATEISAIHATRQLIIDEYRREHDSLKTDLEGLAAQMKAQLTRCSEHSTNFGRIMEAIASLQRSVEEMKQDFKELHRDQHKHGNGNGGD